MQCNIISSGIVDSNAKYQGWPTLILTKDNTLLAGCSGERRKHICPYGRAQIYRSEDFGKTWQGPLQISNGPLDDRDVGLCQAADGSIFAGYFTSIIGFFWCNDEVEKCKSVTIQDIKENLGYRARRSTDDGKTWGEPFQLPVFSCHGPTLLSDGTMIMAGPEHNMNVFDMADGIRSRIATSVARSTDNGQTWEVIANIPVPEGQTHKAFHEMHIVEAADGTLIMHIRNHNGEHSIWQTESPDKGYTWSIPHFVSQGLPSYLTRLSDDRLIMTYSWREKPCGIHARISEDNGKTWSEEIVIYDKAPNGDMGYPSTVELPDHTLFTLWYETVQGVAAMHHCNWKLT